MEFVDFDSPEFEDEVHYEDLKKRVAEEYEYFRHRLFFRKKYNLAPLDSRFLDMTDDEILFDLMLQNKAEDEAQKTLDKQRKEEVLAKDNAELFETDDDTMEKIESGEDIDLDSLIKKKDDWEEL
jgi:RNA polymerase-binding transcription factor DksA